MGARGREGWMDGGGLFECVGAAAAVFCPAAAVAAMTLPQQLQFKQLQRLHRVMRHCLWRHLCCGINTTYLPAAQLMRRAV